MAHKQENYFEMQRSKVHANFVEGMELGGSALLREAQAGAFWAIRGYFTTSDSPALIVMPTGSGKTALMTLASFVVARSRILIVVPSRVIRDQIAREFNTLRIVKTTQCIPEGLDPPKVHVVMNQLKEKDDWDALVEFNVVVSTPKCVSPGESGVLDTPPKSLFDTIFFDEAHHLPASTWTKLVDHFPNARVISFTATPFRNDKKPIPGEIIYSYPLARAIKNGFYRPIEFIPVSSRGTREQKDRRLAKRAKQIWEEESKKTAAKILVRVGQIKDTKKIQRIYSEEGVNLEIVTSNRSLKKNEKAIQRTIDDNDCHGLISVGMLGEGLDLPVLRIAVMHEPHQSFPVTLQFIGRICRKLDEGEGTSKFIAIPEDVEEHTKGLYELDANWTELIPQLADAAVGLEKSRRQYISQTWRPSTDDQKVSILTIFPSYSVCVYRVEGDDIDISADISFTREVFLHTSYYSEDGSWRMIITKSTKRPVWSKSDAIKDETFDLHIYYRVGDLLFQSTTSPGIAREIRDGFGSSTLSLIDQDRLEQVISQNSLLAYYNVGLRRVATSSSRIPTYKTLVGSHAEQTIRESDGLFFSTGHIFGKVKNKDWEQVIGFSSNKGKIWSAARRHITEFTEWCNILASILTNKTVEPLPYVSHLRSYEIVDEFPDKPFDAIFSETFYEHLSKGLCFEVIHKTGEIISIEEDDLPEILVKDCWCKKTPHLWSFQLKLGDIPLSINYDLQSKRVFQFNPTDPVSRCLVKVVVNGREREYQLVEYLEENPPFVFLENGGVLISNKYCAYETPNYNIPDELVESLDWDLLNCNIQIEDANMIWDYKQKREFRESDKKSVIEATGDWLKENSSEDSVILCDHRSGEIADFVVIGREKGEPHIRLYHCKKSGAEKAGARQDDAYELLGQARKCIRWLFRENFFEIIAARLTRERLIKGSLEDFQRLVHGQPPHTAKYSVCIIQPGFDIAKIKEWHDESLRAMFLSLYDELRNLGIDFYIIGGIRKGD
jgi:superfamily II DNA or RNA helicase